jgi:hypothetical protein
LALSGNAGDNPTSEVFSALGRVLVLDIHVGTGSIAEITDQTSVDTTCPEKGASTQRILTEHCVFSLESRGDVFAKQIGGALSFYKRIGFNVIGVAKHHAKINGKYLD